MPNYILALDQGTTSSRAIIFDKKGNIKTISQKEFKQHFPEPGWVEHDPKEIWSTQIAVAVESITKAGLDASRIAGIGITNQRETTIVWDRRTGEPVYNAIVWQDRRTAAFCDSIKAEWNQKIQEKTGLIIDAYFSATKVKWILENVKGAKEKAAAGQLAFGTVDSWLIWNLTKGQKHITDVTNASRTLIYNIYDMKWDEELLDLFGIPASMLPTVCSSSEIYAHTSSNVFAAEIPIAGIAGDQQAALFGQQCVQPGMVKNTYGTGCFMLMNIGNKPRISKNHLVTTVAWQIGKEVTYALEGSIFIGGAVIQWLRDSLGIIKTSSEVEQLANSVEDNGGVYLVPAFAGLGAPHWNQYARGTMVGLTRGSTAGHIARAAIESIALQTRDVLLAMQADAGEKIQQLRVDGGATVNNQLMQIQSDVLQTEVVRPKVTETTALGAAYLAGLAVGFWNSPEEIQKQWQLDQSFQPNAEKAETLIKGWEKAIKVAKVWAEMQEN